MYNLHITLLQIFLCWSNNFTAGLLLESGKPPFSRFSMFTKLWPPNGGKRLRPSSWLTWFGTVRTFKLTATFLIAVQRIKFDISVRYLTNRLTIWRQRKFCRWGLYDIITKRSRSRDNTQLSTPQTRGAHLSKEPRMKVEWPSVQPQHVWLITWHTHTHTHTHTYTHTYIHTYINMTLPYHGERVKTKLRTLFCCHYKKDYQLEVCCI